MVLGEWRRDVLGCGLLALTGECALVVATVVRLAVAAGHVVETPEVRFEIAVATHRGTSRPVRRVEVSKHRAARILAPWFCVGNAPRWKSGKSDSIRSFVVRLSLCDYRLVGVSACRHSDAVYCFCAGPYQP